MTDQQPAGNELPEHEKDFNERIDAFNAELKQLLGKYELAVTADPLILPDGRIAARPTIASARKQPKVEEPTDLAKPE